MLPNTDRCTAAVCSKFGVRHCEGEGQDERFSVVHSTRKLEMHKQRERAKEEIPRLVNEQDEISDGSS